MSCLSSTRRTRIRARIAQKEVQLTAANAAYDASLADGDVSKYRLDTGGGAGGEQEVALRSPSVLLQQIQILESQLDRLYRQLEGGGLVNMNLRRRRR